MRNLTCIVHSPHFRFVIIIIVIIIIIISRQIGTERTFQHVSKTHIIRQKRDEKRDFPFFARLCENGLLCLRKTGQKTSLHVFPPISFKRSHKRNISCIINGQKTDKKRDISFFSRLSKTDFVFFQVCARSRVFLTFFACFHPQPLDLLQHILCLRRLRSSHKSIHETDRKNQFFTLSIIRL